MITIACVRQGTAYGVEYVQRLKSMVARHIDREARFICLTDRPVDLSAVSGVEAVDIGHLGLNGWWAKMALLSPGFRGGGRVVYFDLDTVICGPLAPLLDLDVEFGICANFTRAVSQTWPCRYGSCVMTMGPGWGENLWSAFWRDRGRLTRECGSYGDQLAIERLWPNASLLQGMLPPGFFLGRREFSDRKPDGCSVAIFAGARKPHNTPHEWLKKEWR